MHAYFDTLIVFGGAKARGVVCRVWQEFRNGARVDGLRLSHWTKVGTDPDAGLENL